MSLSEKFQNILKMKDNISNTIMIIFKNTKPKQLKIFPTEIKESILEYYFSFLYEITRNNEFVDFIPNKKEPGTLQMLSIDFLPKWNEIITALNSHSDINVDEIIVDDYTCEGNTILMDIELKNKKHLYFLTRYRNISSWYSNNIRFIKNTTNGKFHEEKGKILALTPCVDVVIYENKCFILNENNFSAIFDFDEVIENQIKDNKQKIDDMDFIDDSTAFMSFLEKSKRQKNAMAKVLMQNRLDKIKKFKPDYIRKQIEAQPELSFIQYSNKDKIIIDNKETFKAVVGILCGTINLDLITKELNGLDECG